MALRQVGADGLGRVADRLHGLSQLCFGALEAFHPTAHLVRLFHRDSVCGPGRSCWRRLSCGLLWSEPMVIPPSGLGARRLTAGPDARARLAAGKKGTTSEGGVAADLRIGQAPALPRGPRMPVPSAWRCSSNPLIDPARTPWAAAAECTIHPQHCGKVPKSDDCCWRFL